MSFTEKIDVLDLIIKILNDHEKKFDELVERLELVTQQLETQNPALPTEELEESSTVAFHDEEPSTYLEEHK